MPAVTSPMPMSIASRAIIESRMNMNLPEKPLTDAEVDALYGLEPVIGDESATMDSGATERVRRASPVPIAAKIRD